MKNKLETAIDFLEARKTLRLTQPAFADALGVDQGTVSKWESGKAFPSGPARKLMARLLADVSLQEAVSQEAAE